jgi:hypothetical protein
METRARLGSAPIVTAGSKALTPLLILLALGGCPGKIHTADYLGSSDDAGSTIDAAQVATCPDVPGTILAADTCSASGCHALPMPAGNLDLKSPNVALRLVGVKDQTGVFLLDPANPEQSLLYRRVTGAAMPRMPSGLPPLDDATTACLLSWIKAASAAPNAPAGDGGAGTVAPDAAATDGSGGAVVRVGCGATAPYTDHNSHVWSADLGFTGGTTTTTNPPRSIANTTDGPLYNSERWSSDSQGFTYDFTVPNGSYDVTLKFAETYATAEGQRIFNVAINGDKKLTDFDIFKAAGAANTAHDETFQIDVAGGKVTIQFTLGSANNPKVDAIEIVSK